MVSPSINQRRYFNQVSTIVVSDSDDHCEQAHIATLYQYFRHYDTRCAPKAVGCVTFTVPSTDAWRAASAIS